MTPCARVGGGDEHGVDVIAKEHVADIVVGAAAGEAARAALLGVEILDADLGVVGGVMVDVANAEHLHVASGQVAAGQIGPRPAEEVSAALPSNAAETHSYAVAGRRGPFPAEGRGGDDAGGGKHGPADGKEFTARKRRFFQHHFGLPVCDGIHDARRGGRCQGRRVLPVDVPGITQ